MQEFEKKKESLLSQAHKKWVLPTICYEKNG
jgi:hypothetical protein